MTHQRFQHSSPAIRTVAARDSRDRFSAAPLPPPPKETRDAARNAHRAALEALFTPKPQESPLAQAQAQAQAQKKNAKIVTAQKAAEGPRDAERSKLLNRLLAADGRPAISKAAEAFLSRGFEFPDEQEVQLQLLEHTSEERVKGALLSLGKILEAEAPKRKTVLDARLRRLEDGAEDAETRELTAALRRRLSGR